MSDLKIIPLQQDDKSQAQIVALLEEALARAKAGDVRHLIVAYGLRGEEELEQVRKALKASQEENAVLKERLRKAAEMTDAIRKLVPRGACGLCGRFDCGGTCFK